MLCELEEPWTQFLEFAQQKCSSAEFQNWLAPIKLLSFDEKEVTLEVPNIFVREYFLDNFKEVLTNFIPSDSNGESSIQFVIAEPEKKKAPTPLPSTPTTAKQQTNPYLIALNQQYTFENYIEGPSNQFVKSAAFGVASRPGKSYNPLFIHGGVGLGKTHLLHGIGHFIKGHKKKCRVHCITTEAFINDLVDHLKNKSVDRMKRFYRNLDILLVDDIQFLQSRLNFEEEFCNTFEALINSNKQIVITSDKPPSQLKLSERMIARMEWGLVAHVGMPDLETRVAIIQHKARQKNLELSYDIAFYIAERIHNNVRQLEGAINRLSAFSRLMDAELNEDMVRSILSELFQPPSQKKLSVDSILKSVASVFEVRVSDLKGDSRLKEIALARQVAMYLSKEMISDSLMKLASSFGGKTHSTLLHAWKKISKELQSNEILQRQIEITKRNLEA